MATISKATTIKVIPGVQEVDVTLSVSLAKGGAEPTKTLLDSLPSGAGPAISSVIKQEKPLTYDGLRAFLGNLDLGRQLGVKPGDRIAVVMPNGPEMAVALLFSMAKATAVPLESSLTEGELVAAFTQLAVMQCLCLKQDKVYDNHIRSACQATGVKLQFFVKGDKHTGDLHYAGGPEGMRHSIVGAPVAVEMASARAPLVRGASYTGGASDAGAVWTDLDSTALLLRTSGTTSKPKVVPLTLRGLLTGSTCIAEGLGLLSTDQCLNVMPYTHIGGISCNLLGSLVTGASVRCASGFDPVRFLGWLEEFQPTWYYAVPTIHVAVRLAANGQAPKHCLRFIRNGAANLTDADARAIQALFGCPIYPTYSMSECMPICQPPSSYRLEKPGTVGVPIASSLRIVGEDGRSAAPASEDGSVRGEVCISGPTVTAGYLDNPEANEQNFFEDGGRRWFRTGDVGFLDADGFVFLTGRSKELIKRGGEQVSPYEVEEVLMRHPAVQVAVVFAVPNDFWGEEVAAAVVLKSGFVEKGGEHDYEADMHLVRKESSLRNLQAFSSLAQQALHQKVVRVTSPQRLGGRAVGHEEFMAFTAQHLPEAKVPRQVKIVTEDELPKTATKKYQRVGLWEKLGLAAVDLRAKEALGSEPIGLGGLLLMQPPVEVSPAVRGARFFFSLWVVFVHVGRFPMYIRIWRMMSVSMPAFFIMAGFLLEKATTRPITNARKFFRSRVIASHPLFLVSLIINIPCVYLLGSYQMGDPTVGVPAVGVGLVVFGLLIGFYGVGWLANGPTWFNLMYNTSIFVFPFLHSALDNWRIFNVWENPTDPCCGTGCVKYAWYPTIFFVVLFTMINGFINWAAWGVSPVLFGGLYYFGMPLWCGLFVCGMMTFRLFEWNRRAPDSSSFEGWGMITDFLTLVMLMLLALVTILVLADGEEEEGWGFELASQIGLLFGRPVRLATPLICVWLYGLATGQGWLAKWSSGDFVVNTLSPASYAMYLFHWPLAYWWFIITRTITQPFTGVGFLGPLKDFMDETADPEITIGPFPGIPLRSWEVPFFMVFITWFSVHATFHWSEKATAWFLKVFDCSFCCCCCLFSGVGCGPCKPEDMADSEGTFSVVLECIANLTGTDADATSKLAEVGLDSFGAGALVGSLVGSLPGLQLKALDVYELETVGDLVALIDKRLGSEAEAM